MSHRAPLCNAGPLKKASALLKGDQQLVIQHAQEHEHVVLPKALYKSHEHWLRVTRYKRIERRRGKNKDEQGVQPLLQSWQGYA